MALQIHWDLGGYELDFALGRHEFGLAITRVEADTPPAPEEKTFGFCVSDTEINGEPEDH